MAWSSRRKYHLSAVWVILNLAYDTLAISNCLTLDRRNHSQFDCRGPVFPRCHLHIQCSPTVVTATYECPESDFVTDYGVAWSCQSEREEQLYYKCDTSLFDGPSGEFSLNITEKGGWGSNCSLEGCIEVEHESYRIVSNDTCKIGSPTTSIAQHKTTTVAGSVLIVTDENETAVSMSGDSVQDSNIDMLITRVLTPLIGVLIAMIVLVLVVVVGLISIVHLRMRRYSSTWKSYGNPDLPFDPHYTPVDIEKPSFTPTPRLSLLSVDTFQNLYTKELSAHSDVCCDQSDSCLTLSVFDKDDTEKEFESGRDSCASSEISIVHTCTRTSLGDGDELGEVVYRSSHQSPSVPYIMQQLPLNNVPRKSQHLGNDYLHVDALQTDLVSDFDEENCSLVESREGAVSCDTVEATQDEALPSNSGNSPRFDQLFTLLLPPLSDPFPHLHAGAVEMNVQLDGTYFSSESGYIQSEDKSFPILQRFHGEDGDVLNQNPFMKTEMQRAQTPSTEQQLLSPTFFLDNESIESLDFSLNRYNAGMHTDIGNSDEQVDFLGIDETDVTTYDEHHGYVKDEQFSNVESGLIPSTLSDVDLDYVPRVSGTVRPTSIDFRLASDYTSSDLSSGYITASCTSCDDSQHNNIMEVLFRQKLRDVNKELTEFDTS